MPGPFDRARPQASVERWQGSHSAAAQMCLGEEARRHAGSKASDDAERRKLLERAAGHYRNGADVAADPATKARALNVLADLYDDRHLAQPHAMELVLRELVDVLPDDPSPLFRLAELQEAADRIDEAEDTFRVPGDRPARTRDPTRHSTGQR